MRFAAQAFFLFLLACFLRGWTCFYSLEGGSGVGESTSLVVLITKALFTSYDDLRAVSFSRLRTTSIDFPSTIEGITIVGGVPMLGAGSGRRVLDDRLRNSNGITSRTLTRGVTGIGCFSRIVVYSSMFQTRSGIPQIGIVLAGRRMQGLDRSLKISVVLSFSHVRVRAGPNMLFCPSFPVPVSTMSKVVSPVIEMCVPGHSGPLFMITGRSAVS